MRSKDLYIYIYIYTQTHIYIYIYIYIYIHTYIYIYTYMHIHTHIHIHTYTHKDKPTHIYTYIYIYTHIHIYTYIHTHTYQRCTHTHTYTHMHTYVKTPWIILKLRRGAELKRWNKTTKKFISLPTENFKTSTFNFKSPAKKLYEWILEYKVKKCLDQKNKKKTKTNWLLL